MGCAIDTNKIGIFWSNSAIVFFRDIAVRLFDKQNHSLKQLFAVRSLNRDFVPTNRPTDSKNCSFSIRLSVLSDYE
jgi:hypothetical protein